MKKLKILSILLFSAMVIVTSCAKDEELGPNPTITFSPAVNSQEMDFSAVTVDTVKFSVILEAHEEIETFTITKKTYVGTDITPESIVVDGLNDMKGKTYHEYDFEYVIEETDFDGVDKIEFLFSLADKEDRTVEKVYTVTLADPETPFTEEVTTGAFYHIEGSLQGAYDLDGDALVGAAGDAAIKSMKNTDGAAETFTGSWTSETANGTMYVESAVSYASIYQENVADVYGAGTPSASVDSPEVGDVYVAKKGTTYYVIEITALDVNDNTCGCGNKGKISFKYKK